MRSTSCADSAARYSVTRSRTMRIGHPPDRSGPDQRWLRSCGAMEIGGGGVRARAGRDRADRAREPSRPPSQPHGCARSADRRSAAPPTPSDVDAPGDTPTPRSRPPTRAEPGGPLQRASADDRHRRWSRGDRAVHRVVAGPRRRRRRFAGRTSRRPDLDHADDRRSRPSELGATVAPVDPALLPTTIRLHADRRHWPPRRRRRRCPPAGSRRRRRSPSRRAALGLRIVGLEPGGTVVELDTATGEMSSIETDVRANNPGALFAGADWIAREPTRQRSRELLRGHVRSARG